MLRRRGGAGVAPRGPSGSRARLPHAVPRQTPPDGPRGRPRAQTRGLWADWRASGRTWPRGGRAGVPGSSAGRAEPSALRGHCHGHRRGPSPLTARPGAVTLRPPVSRGSATKQKRAVRPQVDFAPAEIYADPGVPSSPRWHVAPSQPPEVFSPDPPWEALPPRTPRPSESPAARRPRPAGAVHRRRADFSRSADVLAGGIRGVFLPGDLSGPPLCPSRRLTERTGQSSRAESAASVPGPGGCVIPRSLGPRPPRAPSRARLPRPQSHPQAPPALARPGLTRSPRAALGHVPRGLSKSAW